MIRHFLIMGLLPFLLFTLNSCKKDDNEMLMLIHGHKWGHRDPMPLPVADDERYEFIEPVNYKHYHIEGGDNVMRLKSDSLTIDVSDSKLYIKYKNGMEYKAYTIEKVTHSTLKLSANGDKYRFHHR
jgi:hypothetical protein